MTTSRPNPAAIIVGAIGLVLLLLALDLLQGNQNLHSPGHALLMGPLQGAWRILYGLLGFGAGLALLVAWILFRRLKPLAFVAVTPMIGSFIALLLVAFLVPNSAAAYVVLLVIAVGVPALLALWAGRLGR